MIAWGVLVALGAEIPDVLVDERFRFCHDVGAGGEEVLGWCELIADQPASVCPALHETCRTREVQTGCAGDGRTLRGRALAGDPDEAWQPPELEGCEQAQGCQGEESGCEAPAQRRRLPPWLRWGVALAIAVLLVVGLRTLRSLRRPASPARPAALSALGAMPLADDGLPALPHERLLEAAREALGQGRFADATLLARAAALRGLGAAGHLRLDPARTDREYVRALRGERRADLGRLVAEAEALTWAGRALDDGHARRAIELATRLVAAVLLVVVASGEARAGERFSVYGDAGIVLLLEAEGFEVARGLTSLEDLDAEIDALFLDTTRLDVSGEGTDALARWTSEGGVLVLAGDPSWLPEVDVVRDLAPPELALRMMGPLEGLAPPRLPGGPTYQLCGDGAVWVGRPADEGGCDGALVRHLTVGSGHVVLVADARLFVNAALVDPANRDLVRLLLRRGEAAGLWELRSPSRVGVALLSDAASPTPADAVREGRLLPFLVAVVVLWALWVWSAGVPLRPLPPSRAPEAPEAVAHAAAVGRRWRATGDVRFAAATTARMWWRRLDAVGVAARARRAGLSAAEAAALVARVKALVDGADVPEDEARNTVEELCRVTRDER